MMLNLTEGIEAARLFATEECSEYFTTMVEAIFGDLQTSSGRLHIGPLVTGLYAKTASAECCLVTGTGRQAEAILFIDLAFVEAINLVLCVVLPQIVHMGEIHRHALVERMLFHCVMRSGAYELLDYVAPSRSVLTFGASALAPSIGLRTLLGVECVVSHELGHWRDWSNMPGSRSSAAARDRVMRRAGAGFVRWAEAKKSRYPAETVEAAVGKGLAELEHWKSGGWSEIECDLMALNRSWNTSTELGIPVASFATTVATVFQLIYSLQFATAIILGEDEKSESFRGMARSVIIESMLVDLAWSNGVPDQTWSQAVTYRKRANRRFVELIADRLFNRAQELQKCRDSTSRPSRRIILKNVLRHGFAPRPSGHIHFYKGEMADL